MSIIVKALSVAFSQKIVSFNIPELIAQNVVKKADDFVLGNMSPELSKQAVEFLHSKPPSYFVIKRMCDVLLSTVGLITSAPIWLTAAAVIKATSKGPAFFVQERKGQFLKSVKVYKLRTYYVEGNVRQGPTRIGNFLRKFSIDELPQFINIIKGDFSLVGRRIQFDHLPHLGNKGYDELVGSEYWRLYFLRPGMVGKSTFKGNRGALTTEEMAKERYQFDVEHMREASLWTDFKYMCGTIIRELRKPSGS